MVVHARKEAGGLPAQSQPELRSKAPAKANGF